MNDLIRLLELTQSLVDGLDTAGLDAEVEATLRAEERLVQETCATDVAAAELAFASAVDDSLRASLYLAFVLKLPTRRLRGALCAMAERLAYKAFHDS